MPSTTPPRTSGAGAIGRCGASPSPRTARRPSPGPSVTAPGRRPPEPQALVVAMRAPLGLLLAASLATAGCDSPATRPPVEGAPQIEGVRTEGERGLLLTFVGG